MSRRFPYDYELLDRPGLTWSSEDKSQFITELRALAGLCLSPVPDYQCLSFSSPTALDDKLIVLARRRETGDLIAFSSAIYLEIQSIGTVLDTGLTCVHPNMRRSGLTIFLFANMFFHIASNFPKGIWMSTLAEVPSSLGIYMLLLILLLYE